jgi:Tol biopolymer transport system component
VSPLVQIEDDEDIYAHRWSIDGKILFYTKGKLTRDRIFRIYTHDMSTGKNQELPGTPDDAQDFDVSPDGESIVFLNRSGSGIRRLRIIPAKGGDPRELYSFQPDGSFVITPAWSPDGRYILFPQPADASENIELMRSGRHDEWDMWRFSVEEEQAQKLDMKMATFRHMSIHPNGRHIAFSSSGRAMKFPEIWVMENFLPKVDDRE